MTDLEHNSQYTRHETNITISYALPPGATETECSGETHLVAAACREQTVGDRPALSLSERL